MMLNVIVATHNRGSNLRDLLESLLRCESTNSFHWDVWVVDNNSNDATQEVVKEFNSRDPEHFHYIFERTQGKTYALNRGLRETSGDIIVFTDDDCIPDPSWLKNIAAEFSSNPGLGILGGRIELFDPADKPVTIRTWRDRRALSEDKDIFYFIAGCNMAIRRDVLKMVGEFDIALGPASRNDAAEDVDIIYRASCLGVRVEYVPDVLIYHNHGRRTELDLQVLKRKYLRGRGAFYAKHILKGDAKILKLAYWEFRSVVLSLFKNLITRRSAAEDWQVLRCLMAGITSRLTG
jgi:glycosyltransferase involved in cell wall biosynthesis